MSASSKVAFISSILSSGVIGYPPFPIGNGMLFVSSARTNIIRITSDVVVPKLSNSFAVRSFKSAGTRTCIKLFVLEIVVVLIPLLYDIVIHKSTPFLCHISPPRVIISISNRAGEPK